VADRERVLFICTHNSARSQMAEGLLRHLRGDRYDATSAGTEPGSLHPLAVRAMAEAGVDISGARAKGIDALGDERFDLAVTVCDEAAEACPMYPGAARHAHWSLPDPSRATGSEDERLVAFRTVRDEIRRWIEEAFGG
jgi:arsenate reductase